MANEHRIKNVLLNDGKGVYQVGQVDNFIYKSGQYFGIDNRLNVLDLTYYYNDVDTKITKWKNEHGGSYPTNFDLGIENFSYTATTDQTYIIANLYCSNLVSWFWGDVMSGGVGIYKRGANDTEYQILSSTGVYTNGSRYYVKCTFGWCHWNRTQNPDVAFAYCFNGFKNSETGTYANYILALSNARNGSLSSMCTSYDAKYSGGVTLELLYDTINPIQSNSIAGVISGKTSTWQRASVDNSNEISLNAISRDSTSYAQGVFDDVHNEWLNYVHLSGHWYGGDYEEDPNDGDGGNGGQGGGGGYDKTNTPIGYTPDSQFENDAFSTGFINVYNPSKTELLSLANILCTGVTKNISNMLKKLFVNPLDYIVALNMCHFAISTESADTVKLGGWDTNITMNIVPKQFVKLNGGTVNIPHNFANFLDYYTKIKIYIPYCGVHDLPVDLVMGGTLELRYWVDCLTGSVVAELYLTRDRTAMHGAENAQTNGYMWSFSGNCFISIPIGNDDYRNTVNGVLGLVSGGVTAVATGNPTPILGSVASAVINGKPTYQVGSNIGSNFGYMTCQDAFIILEEPIQNRPVEFIGWRGYPSNTLHPIDYYQGYTEIDTNTFWTDDFTKHITDEESNELKAILNSGFYV